MNQITTILGAIVVCGAAFWAGQGIGYAKGYAASGAVHAAALAEAERENAETQRALIRGVEKVAEDAEIERQNIESRLVAANDAVSRLRTAISDAETRADTNGTSVADAASTGALLASCAARYRDMARAADKLRANVIGLQSYVAEIATLNRE